jgi:hypothetical protein
MIEVMEADEDLQNHLMINAAPLRAIPHMAELEMVEAEEGVMMNPLMVEEIQALEEMTQNNTKINVLYIEGILCHLWIEPGHTHLYMHHFRTPPHPDA